MSLNLLNIIKYLKLLNGNSANDNVITTKTTNSYMGGSDETTTKLTTTSTSSASKSFTYYVVDKLLLTSNQSVKNFNDVQLSTMTSSTSTGSTTTTTTTTTTDSLKTNDRIVTRENYLLNMYTIIAIALVALVLICGMVTAVVIYKIRVNYLLQRQINQLKRIDQQLGLDNTYIANGWTCMHI